MATILLGEVSEYDPDRGLGAVVAGSGEHPFHCTAIADGSRRIEPGTTVAFVLEAGHCGVFEARAVTKLRSPR